MAMRVVDSGLGLSLRRDHFTERTFSHAVSQLLDPQASFSLVAQELRQRLLLDPVGLGRTRGADVIEDVLRRGYKHLLPLEVTEPGWAQAGLDLMVLDVVAVVGLLYLVRLFSQVLWRVMWRVVRSMQRGTSRRLFKQD